MRVAILVAGLMAAAAPALAAETPRPGCADPHIQSVAYDPDRVVLLQGRIGYQLMLEFAPDERLQSVSIGDALAWQVTPNKAANLLFLKPLDRRAVTNMSVVTSQRRYNFDLRVLPAKARATAAPYVVRFLYPQAAVALPEAPPPETPPQELNRSYVATGAPDNMPARIFDDGHKTYFAWGPQTAIPAIFAIGADGKESLVNWQSRGPYTVVEQLAKGFVLRNGRLVTKVTNAGFAAAASPGAGQ